MTTSTQPATDRLLAERKARIFVISASVAIPVLVSVLHFMPKIEATDSGLRNMLNKLPAFNATVNGLTAIILIAALWAIRGKNVALHRKLMTTALVLSVLFLLSYIGYHSTSEHTIFPKDNPMRPWYLLILNSHIILSAVIVPMVLISYTRALAQRFDRHRRIARITWPLWLYVTVSGVVVYFLISPYYPF
ncbi:MAG: DUF420 domain-containing protein [Flavobacteriales bacterium]